MEPLYVFKSEYEFPPEKPFAYMTAQGHFITPELLHWHDCLELNFVRGGRGVNYIGTREYKLAAGQLYLINNTDPHIAVTDGDIDMQIIIFDPMLLGQCGPSHYQFLLPFYPSGDKAASLLNLPEAELEKAGRLFDELKSSWEENDKAGELLFRAKLLELLALIYRNCAQSEGGDVLKRRREYEKILPSVEYINSHLSEPMTLAQLAGISGMSRTYFSGCFKKAMDMNLTAYLEKTRINRACMLLATTNLPVTEIALESGFSSLSSFNAAFRKNCGKTPVEYRKSVFK